MIYRVKLTKKLNNYIKDVIDKDHLEDLIEDLVLGVDETNYDDENLIKDSKEVLLDVEKDKAKAELDDYLASFTDPSNEIETIIDSGKALIDEEDDINDVDVIKENKKVEVDDQYFIELVEAVKDELNALVDEDSSDELKALLSNLLEELDEIEEISHLEGFKVNALQSLHDQLYEDSLVNRVETEDFDEDYEYVDEDQKDLIGFVTNEEGISQNFNLIVSNVELEIANVEVIDAHITNNNLVIINDFIDNDKLLAKKAYAQLDIKLVDSSGNPIDKSLFKGTYVVKFLLPESLRGYENLVIVYIDDNNNILEVFDTKLENNWVSFETDHFSHFYLMGDPVDSLDKLNLWWLIILLIILIAAEVVVIVLKKLSDANKANQANAITLPLLLIIIPKHAWLVITILIIIFVILLAYIIYLFLKLERKEKEEEEPESRKDQEIIQVIKEETIIVKETVVEKEPEVEEEPEVEPAPKVVVVPDVPEGYVKVTRIIYNYSFISRLHLNDKVTDERYNELKNHLLSYDGVSNNISWNQETFTVKGKMVVKLRLQGKTMRVYIGLDPKQFEGTKYNISDNSNVKTHESTPSLQIVKGPVQLMHAKELIDLYMKENEIDKNEDYIEEDYSLKKIKRDKLIEMDLIKVQNAEFIEKAKTE